MRKEILVLVFLALLVAGCSGGSNTPMVPNEPGTLDSIPVIDVAGYDDGFHAIGLLGAYEMTVNFDEMTADLVAKRTSAIGENYIVSGMGFFTIAPCSNCFNMVGFDFADGVPGLVFSVDHPFQPGNPAEPPTAANRLDLDVFDLALVVVPTSATAETYGLADAYPGFAFGADGYTKELAPVTGDTAAVPYWLVVDDSDTGVATFNEFPMGGSGEVTTFFTLAGNVTFDMYLTMGYGFSARKLQRLEPKYYNPEFNRMAAWKVDVIPPQGEDPPLLGNTWQDNDATTPYTVTVNVYDWQQGATVYADPATFGDAPADNIYAVSDVSLVQVEVPGMNTTIPETTTATGGSGTPDDPLVYEISFANENLLPLGEYMGLVKVTDTRTPGDWAVDGRDFLIDSPDGVLLNNYNLDEYATYQMFTATVVLGCGPITGQIDDPTGDLTVANGGTIPMTVSATSDNGGDPVVLYEADWDYDGTTFDVDDSNATGIFDAGPFTVADPCESNIPFDYTIAIRGTDSCDPPNVTIFVTDTVTVDTCLEPVGDVQIEVMRTAGGSYGPPFDTAGPWKLTWAAAGGAQEYAVYYDNDPSDGFDTYTFVGATTSTEYTVPGSHLPSNHYVAGNTYIVRSRSTVGDPGSEAADSQQAHIIAGGWETAPTYQIINNYEGWNAMWELSVSGTYFYYPCTYGSYEAAGTVSARISSTYLGRNYSSYPGYYNAAVIETPTSIADADVRFIDFACYHFGDMWDTAGGIVIGTCSNNTYGGGWADSTEFSWSLAESASPFTGYNGSPTFVDSSFDTVDTSANYAWCFNGTSASERLGGDCNANGDSTDPYVGIAGAKNQNDYEYPYTIMDEWAICIY